MRSSISAQSCASVPPVPGVDRDDGVAGVVLAVEERVLLQPAELAARAARASSRSRSPSSRVELEQLARVVVLALRAARSARACASGARARSRCAPRAAWSSQKPGAPMRLPRARRGAALSASGSKVITDPGELGPDLLELLVERLLAVSAMARSYRESAAPRSCAASLGHTPCLHRLSVTTSAAWRRIVSKRGVTSAPSRLRAVALLNFLPSRTSRVVAAELRLVDDALAARGRGRARRPPAAPSAARARAPRSSARGAIASAPASRLVLVRARSVAVRRSRPAGSSARRLGGSRSGVEEREDDLLADRRGRAPRTSRGPRRGTRRAGPSAPSRAGGCRRAGSPSTRGARASGCRRPGG